MTRIFSSLVFSEIKADSLEVKGETVCSYCRTKPYRRLEDLPNGFDWKSGYREKFQVSSYQVCNHCLYHIALLAVVGFNGSISSRFLVLAYQASMNLEEIYFNPVDLNCETISFIDNFNVLERRDETQSMYCQIFNNAYDACQTGVYKRWFNKNQWYNVLNYTKGRFYQRYILGNKP